MAKNVAIIIGVVAIVAGAAYLKNRYRADSPNATHAKLPRLVELGAGKCTACKKMKPIIEELQKTYAGQLQVDSIDVIDQADAAKPFDWRLIPCQIFLDADGKELWRHEGFLSSADILAKWTELGFAFDDSRESSPPTASQPTTRSADEG
jgi:thioredoxin 1